MNSKGKEFIKGGTGCLGLLIFSTMIIFFTDGKANIDFFSAAVMVFLFGGFARLTMLWVIRGQTPASTGMPTKDEKAIDESESPVNRPSASRYRFGIGLLLIAMMLIGACLVPTSATAPIVLAAAFVATALYLLQESKR